MNSIIQDNNSQKGRKDNPNIYVQSMKGVYWVTCTQVVIQILGILKSIVFTHALFLQDLGLIAIGVMLLDILNAFTESGFRSALIQKKEKIDDYLDTAWIIGIARGIGLYTAIYFIAPLFASASLKTAEDSIPLAIFIIRIIGVCFLIEPFRNIGVVRFQRELDFKKIFWLDIAGNLTGVLLSIVLVAIYRSIWGFIIARLIAAISSLCMSYVLCSYRPRFRYNPARARELWNFGKWMFGGRIFGYLLTECDDLFVSIYLGGVAPLALYRYAFNYSAITSKHLTTAIAKVSFPAYSKLQSDVPRLRDAYLKVLKMSASLTIPISFFSFALGPDFIRLFLNERMLPMIPTFLVLVVKSLFVGVGVTRGPLFLAMGKPNANWLFQGIRLFIMALLIYPLTRAWGIFGTAITTLLYTLIVDPFAFLYVCRLLECKIRTMMKEIIFPVISSIIPVAFIYILKFYWFPKPTYLSLICFGALAVTVYFSLMWLFDIYFHCGIRAIFKDHWKLLLSKYRQKKKGEMNLSPESIS